MWYSIIVSTPFSNEESGDDDYGERSFEVQAGSPNEALRKAEQQISSSQEKIISVEFSGDD
jgi:hypothetical protein